MLLVTNAVAVATRIVVVSPEQPVLVAAVPEIGPSKTATELPRVVRALDGDSQPK